MTGRKLAKILKAVMEAADDTDAREVLSTLQSWHQGRHRRMWPPEEGLDRLSQVLEGILDAAKEKASKNVVAAATALVDMIKKGEAS